MPGQSYYGPDPMRYYMYQQERRDEQLRNLMNMVLQVQQWKKQQTQQEFQNTLSQRQVGLEEKKFEFEKDQPPRNAVQDRYAYGQAMGLAGDDLQRYALTGGVPAKQRPISERVSESYQLSKASAEGASAARDWEAMAAEKSAAQQEKEDKAREAKLEKGLTKSQKVISAIMKKLDIQIEGAKLVEDATAIQNLSMAKDYLNRLDIQSVEKPLTSQQIFMAKSIEQHVEDIKADPSVFHDLMRKHLLSEPTPQENAASGEMRIATSGPWKGKKVRHVGGGLWELVK